MADYSPNSIKLSRAHPAMFLRASDAIGWRSLFVQELMLSRDTPSLSLPPTEDQLLIVQLSGQIRVRADQGEGRHDAVGEAGSIVAAAADRPVVADWTTLSNDPVRAIHLYVPASIMQSAEEEFRLLGRVASSGAPLALGYDDPVVHAVAGQLLTSIDGGEPDLYAQSAAHFLAAHLQTAHRFVTAPTNRRVEIPSDVRIKRVIDRMRSEFHLSLAIDDLAAEACISPFHFCRLFKRATGKTPFAYLTDIRMKKATEMLCIDAAPIETIATACGYRNHGAFSASFRRWSGQSPSRWRLERRV